MTAPYRTRRTPSPVVTVVATLVVALVAAGARTGHAQPAPAAQATDSTAWQRVLVHLVGRTLTTRIAAAAADTAVANAWELRLPADEPQRALLERQLRTLLRARPPVPGDSVVRVLELGPLVISGDTARVEVHVDERRRCPGSAAETGFGNEETVVVPRDARTGWWGAARSPMVLHGDRAPCPRPGGAR